MTRASYETWAAKQGPGLPVIPEVRGLQAGSFNQVWHDYHRRHADFEAWAAKQSVWWRIGHFFRRPW